MTESETPPYRVLITGKIHPIGVEALSREPDLQVDFRPDLPLDEIRAAMGPVHCLISRSETPVGRDLIDAAPYLKVIARAGVGIANIDVAYATDRGILVMNTPAKNTNSAAELTMALLLALVRKLTHAHQTLQAAGWDRHRFQGLELMHKTVGIVGLGNVGHRMARFCRGFDMRVLAYDPYIPDETFERHRAEQVDWDTLLAESDIITVHTPKNEETTGMIGPEEIARMRPGVLLLNAARGGIINEEALLAGLTEGQVAGAGIDTWDEEPLEHNRFRELDNVVMTPHIGASTDEAQRRIAESLAEQVPQALRGGIVESPVNMPQIRMIQGNRMTAYTVLAEKLGLFAAQFVDFTPDRLRIVYRGDIAEHDCRLLRLAFLKGYLGPRIDYVSYVNAEQRARSTGLQVEDVEDPGFTDYESAIKFILAGDGRECAFGGVVFSGPHPRITLVDGFTYEVEPEGTFLLLRCRNKLGVLAAMSSVLDKHGILITRIDFSESDSRRRTMFMFRVAQDVAEPVMEELRGLEHVRMIRKILI